MVIDSIKGFISINKKIVWYNSKVIFVKITKLFINVFIRLDDHVELFYFVTT